MKVSLVSVLSLAFIATASPSGADYSLVGFAKDNPIGPTTGGTGKNSATVTVSSVAELVSAVAGTEPKIVYAKGSFNLTARLRPGSNKVCTSPVEEYRLLILRSPSLALARVQRSLVLASQLSMRRMSSSAISPFARL